MNIWRRIKIILLGKWRVEAYEDIERRLKELDTKPEKLKYYREWKRKYEAS
jgi:aspartyl/asparaginyl-tRNA synthetase